MNEGANLRILEFEDAAIRNICEVLALPHDAFWGPDGKDPRLGVLRSLATVDIEACPGSGKTTLLVAKLALMARKWPDARRGVCVLSHTNVARREIERRLGGTPEGQRLLAYPHFVGTIHGFVNEFLAIPWLRSKKYPIEMIDDDVAGRHRWHKLSNAFQKALEKNKHDQRLLTFRDTDFGLGEIRWGNNGKLGTATPIYQALRKACRESAEQGYFCYDEMFVWARELLEKVPDASQFIRWRFPFLFIDEVQDNSELQSQMLHRLFVEGEGAVLRQRFGDSNQAIHQYAGQKEIAKTDCFPIQEVRISIPNSHRFGQSIADLANPLGLKPQGLQGKRSAPTNAKSDTENRHAIFLFDDQNVASLLKIYAAYLIELFSVDELRNGTFTAVGAVHRPGANDHFPRSVGNYWDEYDHEIGLADPRPKTFPQYVTAGRRLSAVSGETHAVVEKIAEAMLRLVRLASPEIKLSGRKRKHRYVLDLLENHGEARAAYIALIRDLAIDRVEFTEPKWTSEWKLSVKKVAESICGQAVGPDVDTFLAWGELAEAAGATTYRKHSENIYRYPQGNPSVAIRVGSIHSVKGETHTATMVVETFFRVHHLHTLKPWLLGVKTGGGGANNGLQSRLKLHYVAMTRPARLLCLAMRNDAFSGEEIEKLKGRGWRVARVNDAASVWL